ncbi:MAG: hypothetical protein LRY73_12910 [Bacillus sp. (in: Bacteria)]|nr:hypothetical protein [Bacillus sp. (in: firmicutes)]
MSKLRFVSTKEETEDPAGTRRLKRCPRKASSCSINQQQRLTEPYIKYPPKKTNNDSKAFSSLESHLISSLF